MSAIASIAARALPQNEFGGAASILERIALNPQPLPPKESFGGSLASEVLDDWCGTVPKRFPPPPTPPLGGGAARHGQRECGDRRAAFAVF